MQLLVRVVDKVSADRVKNLILTKRGDVIAVKDDGETWGLQELLNPEWQIISVANLPVAQAQALLTPELPPQGKPTAPVAKRFFRVDLDALGIAPLDAKGTPPPRTATFDKDQLVVPDGSALPIPIAAATSQKPATVDPSVIGPSGDVIGPT